MVLEGQAAFGCACKFVRDMVLGARFVVREGQDSPVCLSRISTNGLDLALVWGDIAATFSVRVPFA